MISQCSFCNKENDRIGQRYCRACHANYMRKWRLKYSEISEDERHKANARSHAKMAQRRGHLMPEPCHDCGSSENIEKHHDDYSNALSVIWLCRSCHKKLHMKI